MKSVSDLTQHTCSSPLSKLTQTLILSHHSKPQWMHTHTFKIHKYNNKDNTLYCQTYLVCVIIRVISQLLVKRCYLVMRGVKFCWAWQLLEWATLFFCSHGKRLVVMSLKQLLFRCWGDMTLPCMWSIHFIYTVFI